MGFDTFTFIMNKTQTYILYLQQLAGVALLCSFLGVSITQYIAYKWLAEGFDVVEIHYYPLLYGLVMFFILLLAGSLTLSVYRANNIKQKRVLLHWLVETIVLTVLVFIATCILDATYHIINPEIAQRWADEFNFYENQNGRTVQNIDILQKQPMLLQHFFRNFMMIAAGCLATVLTVMFSVKKNKNIV